MSNDQVVVCKGIFWKNVEILLIGMNNFRVSNHLADKLKAHTNPSSSKLEEEVRFIVIDF